MTTRSLLLAVSIALWMQAVIAAKPYSPANSSSGSAPTPSCMSKWIQVFHPSISNETASEYEKFFPQTRKPIDEQNAATSPILGLLVFGGRSRARSFVNCLSARTPEKCENQAPCQHGGKCLFSSKSRVGAATRGSYACKCPEGFTGEFCQTVSSGCTRRPCQNGGVCQSLSSGRFKCICSLHFAGRLCDREWFTKQMLNQLVSSVNTISKAVERQDRRFTASSLPADWRRTANILRDMEQRLEKKMEDRLANITATTAAPSTTTTTAEVSTSVLQQNSVNLTVCSGWLYKGVCLKSSIIKIYGDSNPSGCNAYKPSTGWAKSDYIAICTHFGGSSNCSNVDTDDDGGLCTNYDAILSFENNIHPDVWAATPTFSWNPSLVDSPRCSLWSGSPATAVYACR